MNYSRLDLRYNELVDFLTRQPGFNPEIMDFVHFLAYRCADIKDSDLTSYVKISKKDATTVRKWYRMLQSTGVISNVGLGYWNYSSLFEPEYFFATAFYLCRNLSKRLYEFEKSSLSLSAQAKFLWGIVDRVLNGEDAMTEGVNWPWDKECAYLLPVLFDQEFFFFVQLLPNDKFHSLICNQLSNMMYDQQAETDEFEQLKSIVKKYYSGGLFGITPAGESLLDEIDLYRYFFDGTHFESNGDDGSYIYLAYKAICNLYKGDYETSLAYFEKSLKIRNKTNKEKNVYFNHILNYFLILAYKVANTEESKIKLKQFLNKKVVHEDVRFHEIKRLAQYVGEPVDDSTIELHIKNAYTFGNFPLSNNLKAIIDAHFGLDFEISKPVFAIFSHELSAFQQGEDAKNFTDIFGGSPIISRLARKEKWLQMLSDLEEEMSKPEHSEESAQDNRQERIGYILWGDGLEPRIQTRRKTGGWNAGRRVSEYDFFNELYPSMDEIDQQIARKAKRHGYYKTVSVEYALPYLIGTDKVSYGYRAPYEPVEIFEEKPYLSIKSAKNGFKVTSNVLNEKISPSMQFRTKNVVVKYSELKYSVVKLTDKQIQVLTPFASLPLLPHSSREVLERLLPKIAEHIEVHSDLLEGGSSLEKKEGSSAIILQITPMKDEYEMKLLVRPLEGGKIEYFPGEGDKTIYDDNDGVRYQVERNIKTEKKNLKEFEAWMSSYFEEEVEGYGRYVLVPEQLLEILEWVSQRKDTFVLEWPKGKKINVIPKPQGGGVNVNIKSGEEWFEIEGDINFGENEKIGISELLALIESGSIRGNYLKLNDEDYLALGESLRKQLKRLQTLSEDGRGGAHISIFNVGPLAELVRNSSMNITTDDGLEALAAKIEEAQHLEPKIPDGLNAVLRDYQYEGFRWMTRLDHWGAGACLADDMGLGKTVQTIAFLLYKAAAGPSLVVAPASVILNWERELTRFAPNLKVIVLNHCEDRKSAIQNIGAGEIMLTTYGILSQEDEDLLSKQWNVVCLDEAHTIKNRQTKMSASAMKLHSGSRIILTGTPIQNYLGELWNLFQFLNPGLLGKYDVFARKFITNEDADLRTLKKMVQPFILRRTKGQVLEELPEKTEITRTIELSTLELAAYEKMRMQVKESLEGEERVSVNALAAITRLRQAACAISLTDQNWGLQSSKVSACMDLLENIVSGGNRALVFSQFTSFLGLITAQLDELGMKYCYLDGSTPIKKREKMVQEFQAGQHNIFIISLKAGGLGLNLTNANYVIHLDPWWNPAIEQQATDRAHRIGQKQNITVYHLISQHTIEEKILRLHQTKRDLADTFLEGADKTTAMTLDDLRQLVEC